MTVPPPPPPGGPPPEPGLPGQPAGQPGAPQPYPDQPGAPQPQPYPGQPGAPQAYPGQYGAAAPGQYGAPPYGPPPKKKSRVGLIIGIVAGVLVLLGGLVALLIFLFVGAVTGPADTTNAFLEATKNRDRAGMDAQSCQAWVEQDKSQDILDQLEAVEPDRGTIQSYNINSSEIENSSGRASGTITYTEGETFAVESELREENGEWKLCAINETP